MPTTYQVIPNVPIEQKAATTNATELQAIRDALATQFPNGIRGLSPVQILEKVTATAISPIRAALVATVVKDWVQTLAAITEIAHNISDLYEQPEQCICDAIKCLADEVNAGTMPRQAQFALSKNFHYLLAQIALRITQSGNVNRQGFCLDDFGAGSNNLDAEFTFTPFDSLDTFRAPLAGCNPNNVPFNDPG